MRNEANEWHNFIFYEYTKTQVNLLHLGIAYLHPIRVTRLAPQLPLTDTQEVCGTTFSALCNAHGGREPVVVFSKGRFRLDFLPT